MRSSRCSFNLRAALTAGALALLVAGCMAGPAAAQGSQSPSPGAPGIGDRLFPTLGNGGYDARHYDLAFTYPTDAPSQTVDGKVTMIARATQALSSFNLDFAGDSVESVRVNGTRAGWNRSGDELVITPRNPIRDHRNLIARIEFTSVPYTPGPEPGGCRSAGSRRGTAPSWRASPTCRTRSTP